MKSDEIERMQRDKHLRQHAQKCSSKFYKAMKIIARRKSAFHEIEWRELLEISSVLKNYDY